MQKRQVKVKACALCGNLDGLHFLYLFAKSSDVVYLFVRA